MATIYKHGGEVGRIEKLTFSMLFCADGKVLRNHGDGWKLWRKLKPDVEGGPAGAFKRCSDEYNAKLRDGWAFAHWRDLVHEFPLRKRALVVEAVRLLPADPDGLWSELEDMGCPVSHGEAQALLDAYGAAQREAKRHAEEKAEAKAHGEALEAAYGSHGQG